MMDEAPGYQMNLEGYLGPSVTIWDLFAVRWTPGLSKPLYLKVKPHVRGKYGTASQSKSELWVTGVMDA